MSILDPNAGYDITQQSFDQNGNLIEQNVQPDFALANLSASNQKRMNLATKTAQKKASIGGTNTASSFKGKRTWFGENANSVDMQQALSNFSDNQVYEDKDGKYQEQQYTDQNGETQFQRVPLDPNAWTGNLYMDNNRRGENKFGTARAGIEARYDKNDPRAIAITNSPEWQNNPRNMLPDGTVQPYGWETGPEGIKPEDGYFLDMKGTSKDVKNFESSLHANKLMQESAVNDKQALADKYGSNLVADPDQGGKLVQAWRLSPEAKAYGSGISEYYDPATNPLENQQVGDVLTLPDNQTNDLTSAEMKKLALGDQFDPERYLTNLGKGAASSAVMATGKILDAGFDAASQIAGDKSGFNTFDSFKDAAGADKLTGYDRSQTTKATATISDKLQKEEYFDAFKDAVKVGPNVLVESMADMILTFSGVGAVALVSGYANDKMERRLQVIEDTEGYRELTNEERAGSVLSGMFDVAMERIPAAEFVGKTKFISKLMRSNKVDATSAASMIQTAGKKLLEYTGKSGLEGATEVLQGISDNYAVKYGTKAAEDMWSEGSMYELATQGMMGFGAGTVGAVGGDIVGGAAQSVQPRDNSQAVNEAVKTRETLVEGIDRVVKSDPKSDVSKKSFETIVKQLNQEDGTLSPIDRVQAWEKLNTEASKFGMNEKTIQTMQNRLAGALLDFAGKEKDLNKSYADIGIEPNQSTLGSISSKLETLDSEQIENMQNSIMSSSDEKLATMIAALEDKELQAKLLDNGIDQGHIDGLINLGKARAVASFQAKATPEVKTETPKAPEAPEATQSAAHKEDPTEPMGFAKKVETIIQSASKRLTKGIKVTTDKVVTFREERKVKKGKRYDLVLDDESIVDLVFGNMDMEKLSSRDRRRMSHFDAKDSDDLKDTFIGITDKVEEMIANDDFADDGNVLKSLFVGNKKENAGMSMRIAAIAIRQVMDGIKSNYSAMQKDGQDIVPDQDLFATTEQAYDQIGRKIYESLGLTLKGSDASVGAEHVALGKAAVQMLESAGIVKIKDNVSSKYQEDLKNKVGDRHKRKKARVDTTSDKEAGDAFTGIFLSQSYINGNKGSANTIDIVNNFDNQVGTLINGMFPGSKSEPQASKVTDIDQSSKKTSPLANRAQKFAQKNPLVMKDSSLGLLNHINELMNAHGRNIYKTMKANPWMYDFIGVSAQDMEQIHAKKASIIGVNIGRIRALENILDFTNDEYTKFQKTGLYFEYKSAVNDRMHVVQTSLNFQEDKRFSRMFLTGGKYKIAEFKSKDIVITAEDQANFIIGSIADALKLKTKDQVVFDTNNESLEYIANEYDLNDPVDMIKLLKDARAEKVNGKTSDMSFISESGNQAKTIEAIKALQDVRRAYRRGEPDNIETDYMPEADANSSGVTNTLMNYSGRFESIRNMLIGSEDTQGFGGFEGPAQEMLLNDFYQYLGDKVTALAESGDKKYDSAKEILERLNDMGFDMRELSKYPLLTDFYGQGDAGRSATIGEAILDMLEDNAYSNPEIKAYLLQGEQTSLRYLSNKRRAALKKEIGDALGAIYGEALTEAFPEIKESRKILQDAYAIMQKMKRNKLSQENSTRNKSEYETDYSGEDMKITIADPMAFIEKTLADNMESKLTDSERQELEDMDLSDYDLNLEKMANVAIGEVGNETITTRSSMPNATSMLVLPQHAIDAAILKLATIRLSRDFPNVPMMLIHDAIHSNPAAILRFKQLYTEAAVEVNAKYDIMDQVKAKLESRKRFLERDGKQRNAEMIKEINNVISKIDNFGDNPGANQMQVKEDFLTSHNWAIFGTQDIDLNDGTGTMEVPDFEKKAFKKKAEKRKADKAKAEAEKAVKEAEALVKKTQAKLEKNKFSIIKNSISKGQMSNKVIALFNELVDKDTVLTETQKASQKEAFQNIADFIQNPRNVKVEILDQVMEASNYVNGKIQIGLKDFIGNPAPYGKVLEVMTHEIDHALHANYLANTEFTKSGKGKNTTYTLSKTASPEAKFLTRVIDLLRKKGTDSISDQYIKGRLDNIINDESPMQNMGELIAVLRNEPDARQAFFEVIGVSYSERIFKAIQKIFKMMRDWMTGPERAAKMAKLPGQDENSKINFYNTITAVERMQDNALLLETQLGLKNGPKFKFQTDGRSYSEQDVYDYVPYLGSEVNLNSPLFRAMQAANKWLAAGLRKGYAGTLGYLLSTDKVLEIHKDLLLNSGVYRMVLRSGKYLTRPGSLADSMITYLRMKTDLNYEAIEKMMTVNHNAAQARMQTESDMVAAMQKDLEKVFKKSELKTVDDLARTQLSSLLMLDQKIFDDLASGKKNVAESIAAIEKAYPDAFEEMNIDAKDLGEFYVTDQVGPKGIITAPTYLPVGSKKRDIFDALTSLYALDAIPDGLEMFNKLEANPEVMEHFFQTQAAMRNMNDYVAHSENEMDAVKDDTVGNGSIDVYPDSYDFVVVNKKSMRSKEFNNDDTGWFVLREPTDTSLGIMARERITYGRNTGAVLSTNRSVAGIPFKNSDFDSDLYSNYQDNNIALSNNNNNDVTRMMLTRDEKNKIGIIREPSHTLYRSIAHNAEIREAASTISAIVDSETVVIKTVDQMNELARDIRSKKIDMPMFLNFDFITKADEPAYRDIPSVLRKFYKKADGDGITNHGGLRDRVTYVREDASEILVGYERSPIFGEKSPEGLQIAEKYARQIVTFMKMKMVLASPTKIAKDMASNASIMIAMDIPFKSMSDYGSVVPGQLAEMGKLRNQRSMMIIEQASHSLGSAKYNAYTKKLDAITKKIGQHPIAFAFAKGFIQSIGTELTIKEKHSVAGLQKTIDGILKGANKNDNLRKLIFGFSEFGLGIEDTMKWLAKKTPAGMGLTEFLENAGEKFEKIKDKKDSEAYIKELIGAPESVMIGAGGHAVQIADIITRTIIYKHYVDLFTSMKKFTPEWIDMKATEIALAATIDYRTPLPKVVDTMSQIGIVMFPHFWLKIQRVIALLLYRNPATSALTAAQGYAVETATGISGTTIFESSLLHKFGLIGSGYGPGIVHNPIDLITDPSNLL